MSIVAFKNKSVAIYGTNISGKTPGGKWSPQGPFGKLALPLGLYGPEGFSINGGHRNVGAVGTPMAFSKNKTPFRGIHACGNGGHCGTYYNRPLLNVNLAVIVPGTQYEYIKPSVLSNRGMLSKKYRWAYNGKYPNYWVKQIYATGPLSDNASQGVYLHNKSASNMCSLNQKPSVSPQTENEYTLKIQKQCVDPNNLQKPYPPSVNRIASSCGINSIDYEKLI